jgi:hypothetical protein
LLVTAGGNSMVQPVQSFFDKPDLTK